jgi:hypothetical protein
MKIILIILILVLSILGLSSTGHANGLNLDKERLANAIYIAEGGAKTKHPYGILKKYKVTTPRQACINTINTALRKWNQQGLKGNTNDFIKFLGKTYAPIGADNDPTGLNRNWVKNVTSLYNKEK